VTIPVICFFVSLASTVLFSYAVMIRVVYGIPIRNGYKILASCVLITVANAFLAFHR